MLLAIPRGRIHLGLAADLVGVVDVHGDGFPSEGKPHRPGPPSEFYFLAIRCGRLLLPSIDEAGRQSGGEEENLQFSFPKWEKTSKGPVDTLALEVDLENGKFRPRPKSFVEITQGCEQNYS